jgi:Tfp pilus assembly protein PilF
VSSSDSRRLFQSSNKASSVHLTYGYSESLQGRWAIAQRSFGECLRIALQEMPTHPVTAAAYYSLADVELAQDHAEVAKYAFCLLVFPFKIPPFSLLGPSNLLQLN